MVGGSWRLKLKLESSSRPLWRLAGAVAVAEAAGVELLECWKKRAAGRAAELAAGSWRRSGPICAFTGAATPR